MKKKKSIRSTFFGGLILFVTVAALVTVALMIYSLIADASGGNRVIISLTMLLVILVISLICTLIDYLRRRLTVNKPLNKILDATDKIALGDFSVRLKINHSLSHYDEFDYIMENLNKMAAELSRTEVLHSDFISNVSHELKTPLSIIQSYATYLQREDIDGATRLKYTETLKNAASRLSTLISNILKLNKLENQQILPNFERVNLSEMLAESVLSFEEIIEGKDIVLSCDFDESVTVNSLPNYLEIVWNNLLSNAIKFTERGGSIALSIKKEGDFAVVEISDTGCGISAETGKHIFDKFYQGDTSHSQEGNGLGLALVKKVIDVIGGTISVKSEMGKGTTFTITLSAQD